MRLHHSSILIFGYFSCLGFYSSLASATTPNLAPKILELAQSSSISPTKELILIPGNEGVDVQELQTQLKELGYYNGAIDGKYGNNLTIAIAKFQKAQGLKRIDGIADLATQRNLQKFSTGQNKAIAAAFASTPQPKAKSQVANTDDKDFIWWSLLGLGFLGTIGALIFFLRWFNQTQKEQQFQTSDPKALSPSTDPVAPPLQELANSPSHQRNTTQTTSSHTANGTIPAQALPLETTSRITKLNIVDELIKDLRSPEPSKRHKAIWDLGQQGDSRAVQPLVNLLVDADSQQRSLILAALTEINVRSLKPVNRALAISMQDESPQVRQNAIRDLTRVYDMMAQMSQILSHALEDPDTEVRATAKYALTQMNRVRTFPDQQSLSIKDHENLER